MMTIMMIIQPSGENKEAEMLILTRERERETLLSALPCLAFSEREAREQQASQERPHKRLIALSVLIFWTLKEGRCSL